MSNLRPDCCTSHLVELASFAEDLLTRHGITHWLDYGTLLGAVRNQEFIPWDWDVDMGVLATDLERIAALAPEVDAAGYHFQVETSVARIYYSALNQRHVDLYFWSERGDRLDLTDPIEGEWPGMNGRGAFPRTYLENPGTVYLYGKAFPAPAPVDRFIVEHRYGADYLTPRRPIMNEKLYADVKLEELTPQAQRILDEIGDAERRFLELSRSRLSHYRPWRIWSTTGLPLTPDPERVSRIESTLADGDQNPSIRRLVMSLALLEQAADELEKPPRRMALRRMHRRLVRLHEGFAARREGRPHRAGFPFGV